MEDRNQPCRGNGNRPATVCYWNRHLHSRSGQRATGSEVSTSVRASYQRAFTPIISAAKSALDGRQGRVNLFLLVRLRLGGRDSVRPLFDDLDQLQSQVLSYEL